MLIRYLGPSDGVEIPTPDEVPRQRVIGRDEVGDIPDELGRMLISQQPGEFEEVKPARKGKNASDEAEGGED